LQVADADDGHTGPAAQRGLDLHVTGVAQRGRPDGRQGVAEGKVVVDAADAIVA
jgi:hypothetical protein